jgi:hypothetical protein
MLKLGFVTLQLACEGLLGYLVGCGGLCSFVLTPKMDRFWKAFERQRQCESQDMRVQKSGSYQENLSYLGINNFF